MQKNSLNKRKIYLLQFMVLSTLFGYALIGCKTIEPEAVIIAVEEKEPEILVLEEIMPPPPEPEVIVVALEEKPLPVVSLYAQGKIMEIEVVQGEQSFLYIKVNSDLVTGEIPKVEQNVTEEELINMPLSFTINPGMKGDIFTDPGFSEKAGEFEVVEQYSDIYKAKINHLNFVIDRTSVIQIRVR